MYFLYIYLSFQIKKIDNPYYNDCANYIKDYLHTENIAQIIENLNILNKSIFIILSNFEPLSLNNTVSKDLQAFLDNPELNELFNNTNSNSNSTSLYSLLNPIAKLAKEETINKRRPLREVPIYYR